MSGKSKTGRNDLPDDDVDWDDDGDDNDTIAADADNVTPRVMGNGPRARDWRDLERFKEERELQKLMQGEYDDL